MVLKKPSQLFESNRQEKSTEPPNLFESIDRFKGSLENVDQISTQIQELSEELSQKVSKTELENTLLSHLLVLEENFDHIQKQIKGINKNDIRQFKESVSDIGEVVDNLIYTELPKYRKQVAGSELRIEKRLDTFTETFDSNFSILENQLAEKMEFCLQRIEDILGELRYDEQIAEHSKVLDELKESTSKLSSDVEVVERYISNHHSDVIDLREELLRKIELLPIEDLAERINQVAESYNKISEEITLAEGLLNEPPETNNSDLLTPLDQNFVTLDQLNAHYKLFLARIQQQLSTVGGGGETQLKYLDDIVGIATNASAYDGKFLKYDHSIGKFEFVTVSGGGGGGDYASVAGIATFATSSGIATYASVAGIATFATTAGVSTYAATAGIATYSSVAGIATFATTAGYASTAGIATFATSSGIATYASTAGIATYASNSGIATFATTAGYASTAGIATYASVAGIATFATTAGYASTAGIATEAQSLTAFANLNAGITTISTLNPVQLRAQSVSERTTLVSGNTVGLAFTSGGGNIAICTNPTGNITLNVTDIPTGAAFDNNSITFSVIIAQTGTARSCTAVTLNGVSRTIHWTNGSLANAISGVSTNRGFDIYNFTGINTVGSASTTANYVILGSVNGGFFA